MPGFEFTTDKRRLPDAQVVVFHDSVARSTDEVCKRPSQLWVSGRWVRGALSRMRDPAFARQFDLTAGYRQNADVFMTYGWSASAELLRNLPQAKTREKLVALFSSGRVDRSGRTGLVTDLMRRLDVHSYGRCYRNRTLPEDVGRKTKLETIAGYKFTLALENAVAPDYVTEKLYDALVAGSVPVFLGAPNVDEFAPGDNCYINAADFASANDLADYLLHLNGDEAAYQRYLSWHSRPLRPGFLALMDSQRTPPLARLCSAIQARGGAGPDQPR